LFFTATKSPAPFLIHLLLLCFSFARLISSCNWPLFYEITLRVTAYRLLFTASIEPYVKFGISPFAIWKNKTDADPRGSDTKGGLTNYEHLYADMRGWLEKGWIDYNVPQLYFHIGYPIADYAKLLAWWSQNTFGKHLYIGQGTYRVNSDPKIKEWYDPRETGRQLRLNRKSLQVQNSVFFSSKSVMSNPLGVQDSLRSTYYRLPALPPTMPWLDSLAPNPPAQLKATNNRQNIYLTWEKPSPAWDGDTARYYVIYRRPKGTAIGPENPAHILAIPASPIAAYTDESARPGKRYTYAGP